MGMRVGGAGVGIKKTYLVCHKTFVMSILGKKMAINALHNCIIISFSNDAFNQIVCLKGPILEYCFVILLILSQKEEYSKH